MAGKGPGQSYFVWVCFQEHLVEQLCLYNDVSEALKWADCYSLDDSVIPHTVRSAREKIKRSLF
ncbi:hypothetical protein DPMN_147223 [Dreissena polymorpha]|uniref:Uncharacterized protein n=1 Tax=Dreissena polymorpha TaxID=45954 RepID=A0A9D4F7H2_DREPO|nr:hypothetical protein DPMN_147223 [Dreissena polymorpha]